MGGGKGTLVKSHMPYLDLAGAQVRGNEARQPDQGQADMQAGAGNHLHPNQTHYRGTHPDSKTGVPGRHSPGAPGNPVHFTTDGKLKYFLDLKLKIIIELNKSTKGRKRVPMK